MNEFVILNSFLESLSSFSPSRLRHDVCVWRRTMS